MIQSFTAITREIDEPKAAVAEILAALAPEKNLRKNSLGIVTCFSEFIDTGVLQAICDALPFDCVGATTCVCAAEKQADQLALAVMVLTSDDCCFKTTATPIQDNFAQSIDFAVSDLLKQSQEKPALLLSYFPLINTISGDMMLTAIDKATGGIPLFGTTAVDHMMDYSTSQTIHNGQGFREAAVLAAIYGPVKFECEVASLNEEKIRSQKAVITESNGNILMGVNGKSALNYLEEIGLTKEELSTGLGVIPLVVDHKDGTKPVARAVFALTPDGAAVCGGAMPVDATLAIGRVDMADVLSTTENTLKPLMDEGGAVLSYSCIARYLVLGTQNTAEAGKVIEIAQDAPYLFACSGGEICPLPDADGNLKNYYHNYTIAFCRLS
ncbi:MAG: FIST C-terminal domain-containing protein [Clostridia bacterium]|nr:FIST C-terminal domain-containing protein [Clostridia bacterium]